MQTVSQWKKLLVDEAKQNEHGDSGALLKFTLSV